MKSQIADPGTPGGPMRIANLTPEKDFVGSIRTRDWGNLRGFALSAFRAPRCAFQ
jgi:hypothetical protein